MYNQCILCTVGSHITYRLHAKAIKNIKIYVMVKFLLVSLVALLEYYPST